MLTRIPIYSRSGMRTIREDTLSAGGLAEAEDEQSGRQKVISFVGRRKLVEELS